MNFWLAIPLITILMLLAASCVADSLNLVDVARGRKKHEGDAHLTGGLAIFFTLCVFVGAGSVVIPPSLLFFFGLIVLIGAIDDGFNLTARLRLILQSVSCLGLVLVHDLPLVSVGLEVFDVIQNYPLLGKGLAAFALVGLINVFNMADGIDGLASGYFLLAMIIVGIGVVARSDISSLSPWYFVVWLSVATFWCINISKIAGRKVFLGDAGSLLLGLILGFGLLEFTQSGPRVLDPVVGLWVIAIPIVDTSLVMWQRLRKRQSVFCGDRRHIHYRLVDMGHTPSLTLFILLITALFCGLIGLILTSIFSSEFALGVFCLCWFVSVWCLSNPTMDSEAVD